MPRQSTKVDLTCACCGKPFQAEPNRVKNGRKHCSRRCYHASRVIPIEDQFSRSLGPVTPAGCIPWVGLKDGKGYGVVYSTARPPQRLFLAHRLAWEFANGPIPDGLCVLHNCPGGDNPACVNAAHLFLGTQLQNVADMVAKDRQHRGERVSSAKVTPAVVRSIRERYAAGGITQTELGVEHGLHNVTVSCIIKRKTWKHVT